MNYKQMIANARTAGVANEKAMYAGIDRVDTLLSALEKEHPHEYWKFMRSTHEDLYGPHYDEEFANWDVSQMHSTDKEGKQYTGAHWTRSEIEAATASKSFPKGTTKCDLYVVYNAMWHDMHKLYSDAEILDMAYLFYFADEDAPSGKVWKYINAMLMAKN
jgi:hypothetical protein